MLVEDVKRCRAECEKSFAWFKDMDRERQDVIVELDFNIEREKDIYDKIVNQEFNEILPTEKEMEINSRSKSAKLRIFQKK